jgi:hypothetical protein
MRDPWTPHDGWQGSREERMLSALAFNADITLRLSELQPPPQFASDHRRLTTTWLRFRATLRHAIRRNDVRDRRVFPALTAARRRKLDAATMTLTQQAMDLGADACGSFFLSIGAHMHHVAIARAGRDGKARTRS